MVYLYNLKKISAGKYEVLSTHKHPFHSEFGMGKTKEELEEDGVFVDNVPLPEVIKGKTDILYINPTTKELWYEYEDIPKTQEELQAQKINDLEGAIMELTMILSMTGGM